ncbi:ribokinase [Microbacterium insulae]
MASGPFGMPSGPWLGPVAVLGSVNLDMVSRQERLPVPGETIFGHELQRVPGGKGLNQAVAAARSGAGVAFLGRVGADAEGTLLAGVLSSEGIDVDRLARDADRSTGVALVSVLDDGENAIVVMAGANGSEDWTLDDELVLADASALVTQLERPPTLVRRALESARRHALVTILTPAPVTEEAADLLPLVDLLLLNEHEATSLARVFDPIAAASRLSEICELVVMTRGATATCVARGGEVVMEVPSRPTVVVDTTGAGDCFAGTLIARLAAGDALPEALRWATTAASLSVARPGASSSMPQWDEVRAADA